ncbi:hypothetical protein ACJX0J_038648, partial [Zea mays]
ASYFYDKNIYWPNGRLFLVNEGGTCQQILKNKYLGSKSLIQSRIAIHVNASNNIMGFGHLMTIQIKFFIKSINLEASIIFATCPIFLIFLSLSDMNGVENGLLTEGGVPVGEWFRNLKTHFFSVFYFIFFKIFAA